MSVSTEVLSSNRDLIVPLQGSGGDSRRVSNTQTALFPDLLVEVLFGEGIEFLAVLLFDGTTFTVEGLDIVEPCDSAGDPCVYGFEAILQPHVSPVSLEHDPADRQPTNLQLGAELRRDV